MNIQIFDSYYYPKVQYSVSLGYIGRHPIFQVDYCKPKYLRQLTNLKKKILKNNL